MQKKSQKSIYYKAAHTNSVSRQLSNYKFYGEAINADAKMSALSEKVEED